MSNSHSPKWFSSTSTEMYGSMSWSSGLPNVMLWRFWKSVGRSPEASHTFKRMEPENMVTAIRSRSSSSSGTATVAELLLLLVLRLLYDSVRFTGCGR